MADTAPPIERELTINERMTWGECPVCAAGHGKWCHAGIGFHFGVPVGGSGRMQTGDGAHLSRLSKAPTHVRLVAAEPPQ